MMNTEGISMKMEYMTSDTNKKTGKGNKKYRTLKMSLQKYKGS